MIFFRCRQNVANLSNSTQQAAYVPRLDSRVLRGGQATPVQGRDAGAKHILCRALGCRRIQWA